jgi:hypothetical protein
MPAGERSPAVTKNRNYPQAVKHLKPKALRPPLGERIAEMSKVIADAKRYSSEYHPPAEAVRAIFNIGGDGERLYALALMQADPKTVDIESVLDSISNSHSAFEQYNALVTAQVGLDSFNEAETIRLATAIRRQMDPTGYISRSTDRQRVAEQIMRAIQN